MRAPSDRKRRTDAVLDRLAALAPAHRDALREALLARRVRGHDAVAQALAALGITHLYAMPGLPTDETIGACARAGLIVTGARHQQATVMMAAAHNYIAGRLAAVAMVSSGVAVTNATTGVQVAQDNGWPVLLLAGAVEQAAAGMGAFTELDGMRAMRPLAKDCLCAGSTAEIGRTLAAAARIACDGRPGAVHVDLPEDSLSGFAAPAPVDIGAPPVDTLPDAAALDRAADLLLGARAPLLVFGKGVRWDDAYRPLRALIDHLQLPFIASPMGRGLLPDDHPLSRSAEQGRALAAADCVLLVGARLNWTFRYGAEIRPGTPIVQIDCCDAAFAEGPSRALTLAGRAGTLLPALLERIRQHRPLPAPVPDSTGGVIAAPSAAATDRPTPDEVAAALAAALPTDAITVLDGNVTLLAAQKHIVVRQPLSRLTPGTSGCMGSGLPFAIAAARAGSGRPVVLVTGDMALGLNFFELETAVRHGIKLVVILLNNDGPSGERRQRKAFPAGHGERLLAYRQGLRYDLMAQQLGVRVEQADGPATLPAALARALGGDGPALIQLQIDPLAS